ncbi:MAG TPA: hypothetical protein DDW50_03970 [Firmicutes bacterium]|jgi:TRAP-type transport system periplasmic protein|nr:hypothetical protein [Bacillota bacterium]
MKKICLFGAFLMAFLVISCVGLADNGKTILKLGHVEVPDPNADCVHYASLAFAQYVNSKSNDIQIQIYPNSQLGGESEELQSLQMGVIDLRCGGTAIMSSFVKQFGVLDLPFLWKNYNQFHKAIDGPVGAQLAALAEKSNIKVLSWFDSWGYRNVLTSKTINTADDLKGLKIRCIETPTNIAAMKLMGANPTPLAFGEIYTAFQSGVIDGMEQCAPVLFSNKFYEVAKNVAVTEHLFGPLCFNMSIQTWNKLSDQDKKIILAGAKFAADKERSLTPIKEKQAFEALKKQGVKIVKIDTSKFAKAAIDYQNSYAKQIGVTDLLNSIRKIK